MRPTSIAFASALMLGGMSMAYAQDGPGNDRERPGQTQEQSGQSRGADRGQAETKADRGGSPDRSESRASRSNGEGRSQGASESKAAQGERRDSEQGQRSQAQENKSGSASENRASRKDDADQASGKDQASDSKAQREDRKAADRKDSDQQKTRSSQSRDDDDQKRAASQKDDDAKRAESGDRQRQDREDAKRADRKDGDSDRKSARVELQGDKKERVRNVFREHSNVKERTNVDIDISVGRSLPRDWDYYPVPASIIEVVPEYRGYRYVYVEDRYVIVEPDTYEVVTVIDAGGSGNTTTASRGRCSSDITLSSSDREYILKSVQMRNEVDVSGVSIGWRVPDTVRLETFPAPVTDRISGLSSCRYFVVDDRIAIVDPDAHNVVILVQD